MQACNSERGLRAITRDHSSLVMALRLHQGDGLRRLEVELRVLARQTDRQIAQIMGVTVGMVRDYVSVFYDVRGRLEARGYIESVVAGLPVSGPISAECLARLYAYHRGPHLVVAWLDYFSYAGETHDLTTPEGRGREAIEIVIAARNLPDDAAARKRLLKQSHMIFGLPDITPQTPSVAQILAETRGRLLDSLPWLEPAESTNPPLASPPRRKSRWRRQVA
jgi:hypothetical protein